MKKLLIIGPNSDLAKNIINELKYKKISIFKLSRKQINFELKNSKEKLYRFLKRYKPSHIINCVGLFDNNYIDFNKIFNINTKVGWNIISFYLNKKNQKVSILLIGSKAHNKPRKNYILYASSKTALNSIVISAKELFKKTKIKINIINPPAMRGKMRKKFFKKEKNLFYNNNEIEPKVIAKKIIKNLKLWKKKF